MPYITDTNWDLLVDNDNLEEIAKIRSKEYIEVTINKSESEHYFSQGYSLKKENKKTLILQKPKNIGAAFEDEVWTIFYKMGFKVMNKDSNFAVVYDKSPNLSHPLSQQLDIVAIDDEVCMCIECKQGTHYDTNRDLSAAINEVAAFAQKVKSELLNKYPNRKFVYVFATKNIIMCEQDKNRMKSLGIIHFDYATVLYYKKLSEYMGNASKYQLLGHLFAGKEIRGLDVTVPAIRGQMGGFTYYTFLMQPEQLLKIGYVLHKTNANNDYEELLPSYQRLIKADRLKSVRSFVDNGGFFPNSLIISIDTRRGQSLQFDYVDRNYNGNDLAKMGNLHLPKTYQSAYVIDGQHRLYGYAGSTYSSTNSIPVVAFENLSNEEQLKIFLEINENQKSVPKPLRNILEIDIYYDSEDPIKRQSALLGRISKRLGEDSSSALKSRIIIGEDAGTDRCCITIENLKIALEKTGFFNKYKKANNITKISSPGLFSKDTNNETMDAIYPLLLKFFNYLRDYSEDWNNDDSSWVKNNTIMAFIKLFSDMVFIEKEKNADIINNLESLWVKCQTYIDDLILVLTNLTTEEWDKLKVRGAAGPWAAYRFIQMKMFELDSNFVNDDIKEYYENNYLDYNQQAQLDINSIKKYLINMLKNVFTEPNWTTRYLSETHENDLNNRVNSKNNSFLRNGSDERTDIWKEITIADIQKIIVNGTNWSEKFKDIINNLFPTYTKTDFLALLAIVHTCSEKIRQHNKVLGNEYSSIKLFIDAIGED